MLRIVQGNLLLARTQAIVNPVNTVGVMGKGLALAVKKTYPHAFIEYQAACNRGAVQVGRMFVTEISGLDGPRWLIHFPTKKHWRNPSRLDWIRSGLVDLRRVIEEIEIRSVAIPALGCGLGGLDWSEVRLLIEAAFADLPDLDVELYEPAKA